MTTAKWYEEFDNLLDESLKGYYRDWEKDTYLNAVISEWINAVSPYVERDETVVEFLVRLTREYQDNSGSDTIPLTFDYKYLQLVSGTWGDTSRKITLDKANWSESSWHVPSDAMPRYEQLSDDTGPKIRIKSDSVPDSIAIKYILTPPQVSQSAQTFEWDRYFLRDVQYAIIRKAIALTAIPAGDTLRLRTEAPANN